MDLLNENQDSKTLPKKVQAKVVTRENQAGVQSHKTTGNIKNVIVSSAQAVFTIRTEYPSEIS